MVSWAYYRRFETQFDYRDWLVRNIFPTTKDPDHAELVTEHLKALDRSPTWNIFQQPAKDTGVVHDDPAVGRALDKTR